MAKKLTEDQKAAIFQRYQIAFEAANPGKRVQVVDHGRGWYSLYRGGDLFSRPNKYRISKLVEMTERLEQRVVQ